MLYLDQILDVSLLTKNLSSWQDLPSLSCAWNQNTTPCYRILTKLKKKKKIHFTPVTINWFKTLVLLSKVIHFPFDMFQQIPDAEKFEQTWLQIKLIKWYHAVIICVFTWWLFNILAWKISTISYTYSF